MVDTEQIRSAKVYSKMSELSWEKEDRLNNKIADLRRTIQFLQTQMHNAKLHINSNPGMAKLIIDEALNDNRFKRS